jgi:phosphate transport system substrate-binding protein
MSIIPRQVGLIFLFPLLLLSTFVTAQDNDAINVVGSGIVAPLFEALKTASAISANTVSEVTGTRTGFERFCQGQADITNSNRSVSADENLKCASNNIDYTELLIAHNIIAFVAPVNSAYGQCLTATELNSIFAPSAQSTNWNQVNPAYGDTNLTAIAPNSSSPVFDVLNNLIEGDGVRTDVTAQSTDADTINTISATPGSIGVISYITAPSAGDSVKIIQLNTNETIGCQSPSAENVEQRLYQAANPLFVYVNRASLNKPGLKDLLAYMIGQEAAPIIQELGLTPPSAATSETSKNALDGTGNTRPFSEATSSFQIPPDVTGQVKIAGAASARDYITSLTSAITAQYASLATDVKLAGQTAGIRRMCNGEIDMAVINSPLTDEQTQNCQANNITTLTIDLGKQVVVLVANAAGSHLACLTPEQIKNIWSASSAKSITNWNQVDPSFPDQKMTLFAPTEGDNMTDMLLTVVAGQTNPGRADIELNSDPLYRAAATANVNGALTFMSWSDYQKVVSNNQQRIQLVGVNAGKGCVVPGPESINDASYSLVRDARLVVKTSALNTIPVQSFLWFMSSDINYNLLEQAGFTGVGFGSLPALRQTLQKAFLDAAKVAAEATPEPTTEVTPEATPVS